MNRDLVGCAVIACAIFFMSAAASAADRIVGTTAEFSAALAAAEAGDQILLRPGVYRGGHSRDNLRQVTIRSMDPLNAAVIEGGATGIQLSDAQHVTIQDIEFR